MTSVSYNGGDRNSFKPTSRAVQKYLSPLLLIAAVIETPLLFTAAQAATLNAPSCSQSDVQNAINSSASGDTVIVPAGSCNWSSLSIPGTKGITLMGTGTIISGAVTLNQNATASSRITGFTFTSSDAVNIFGSKTSAPFRLDNCTFINSSQVSFINTTGNAPGLIDHNNLNAGQASEMIHNLGMGPNDTSGWSDDITPGSSNAVYIEQNSFTYNATGNPAYFWGTAALQSYYGARTVFRYNTLNNVHVDQHGTAGMIGARWWEIYENTFFTGTNVNQDNYIRARAGSGVIFNNHKTGSSNLGAGTIELMEEDSGYPALYQIGRGKNQTLDPAYVWGNAASMSVGSGSSNVQANRDFYLSARSGYLAFTYPYPLTANGLPNPSGSLPPPGANWYVRPNGGSYGAENGSDWTNAFDGFSSINWAGISCGDTIWIAGGTYTQPLIPAKKCTSASPLSIRRALSDASAATSAAGWSAAFDTTVHQSGASATISFEGDYDSVVISGRTTAAGGANGWWLDRSATTGGAGIEFNVGGSDNNRIEYLDLQGPGEINYTSDGRAIDCTPSGTVTGNTFSHLKIWDWESGIYVVGCANPTFEFIDMYDIAPLNWQLFHPNGIIIWGSPNGIVRYSKFHKGPKGLGVGEGVFFEQGGGATGWQVYGNLFYDLDQSGWKAIEITSAVGAIKVYNNTFHNILAGSLYTSDTPSCTGGEWRNNLNYQSANNTCGTASNNLAAASASVFLNAAAHDYHIVGTVGTGFPRNAGANVAATVTADLDGNLFGADGAWDIGAYEYSGASSLNACDLNSDSATNISDVQLCVNQAIGTATCTSGDLNKDSACNVIDVQRVVNAVLGGQCVTQ
jgi:hypothetical protein